METDSSQVVQRARAARAQLDAVSSDLRIRQTCLYNHKYTNPSHVRPGYMVLIHICRPMGTRWLMLPPFPPGLILVYILDRVYLGAGHAATCG